MPFQMVALAMRANTGSPLTKLVWIWLLQNCDMDDAPNGKAFAKFDLETVADFAQASQKQVQEALHHLQRLRLIGYLKLDTPTSGGAPDSAFADLNLPMTDLQEVDRKRIKCTPDQVSHLIAQAGYRCPGCGVACHDETEWHVDHIIPRARRGADVEDNCQILCPTCNGRKGAKLGWVDFLR